MRKITEIILHCTATHPDFMEGNTTWARVQEVKRWHTELNGWSDIGYHFLIDRDGTVLDGRPINRDGAHVKGRNTGTIGISLFGGHGSAETDQFSENFTEAQEAALVDLIQTLQRKYGDIPVTGHNQYAAKACPGFNAPDWWEKAKASKPADDLWGELIKALKRALELAIKISGKA
jgi:N-acetyl-anhydromuramyl-L-alanine amidase AmpD